MTKISVVQEESLQKAVDFFNGLDNDVEIKKFFKEQPYITSYILAITNSEGLNEEVLQEVLELVFICWLAFDFEGVRVPEIGENIIDHVLSETENMSKELINSMGGGNVDDPNIKKKVNDINNVLNNADFQDTDELIDFIRSNNLEGFMDSIIKDSSQNSQSILLDFCINELNSSEFSHKTEEIGIMQGTIMSVIKCFDMAVNKTPVMRLVKTPDVHRKISKRKGNKYCYQVKLTLKGIKPPIWRRLLISSDISLDELNEILIDSMGWDGYHLYDFDINGLNYAIPDGEYEMHDVDSRKAYLSDLHLEEGSKFTYRYDFGDNWEHTIIIEKILPFDKNQNYPVCIKGKRNCPPEDVGGVWGYMNMLSALSDKNNSEHKEYLEWLGGDFDPEEFDIDEVNFMFNDGD